MKLFSEKVKCSSKSSYLVICLLVFICLASCKKERNKVEKKLTFKNILVLGNSITVTPPTVSVGWYSNWGMAASRKENDYCHILASKLNANINPVNFSGWEHQSLGYDLKQIDKLLDVDYDLIIIRLGENVSNVSDLKSSFTNLIRYILQKKSDSKLVVTSCFWANEEKDNIFRSVSAENKLPFIKLSQLGINENLSYMGALVYDEQGKSYKITDYGVAYHPGDVGMKRIAEAIYEGLKLAYQ